VYDKNLYAQIKSKRRQAGGGISVAPFFEIEMFGIIPNKYFIKFDSPILLGGNMKKLGWITLIFLVGMAMVANAEEAAISPFIGTWGGQWADRTGYSKKRIAGTIKLIGDGKGGVLVESYESGGKTINLKVPPKVEQNSPDKLLILWPNGNRTTLKLDGSVISAENIPASGVPWYATFQKEK
jgi:hypothetical protein